MCVARASGSIRVMQALWNKYRTIGKRIKIRKVHDERDYCSTRSDFARSIRARRLCADPLAHLPLSLPDARCRPDPRAGHPAASRRCKGAVFELARGASTCNSGNMPHICFDLIALTRRHFLVVQMQMWHAQFAGHCVKRLASVSRVEAAGKV